MITITLNEDELKLIEAAFSAFSGDGYYTIQQYTGLDIYKIEADDKKFKNILNSLGTKLNINLGE